MIPLCLTCAIVAETQGRRAYGLQRSTTCEWCGAVARCGIGRTGRRLPAKVEHPDGLVPDADAR